ncbi:hypothetical protein J31TS6_21270 [Brevibacillus reuszeri]|uniref:hypothetical protein n=1 Tax=Brevibacillus reuszeri TaxID=54915 RepID=UPI001B0A0383|nr:hypothetical protein [Brevibacillus reuszeri]GIO06099.1 hypothetical protein J31TS6_21270 [Brevibacillus reuszeri]
MKREKRLEHSHTRNDLLASIENMILELKQDPEKQNNESLFALLSSMTAWLEKSNVAETPSREAFTKILHASNYFK